uniref:Uncharacterized protein n=1 Tax=Ciona intestinalis TaxID=7719 RepID=H2XNP2_CIOIN
RCSVFLHPTIFIRNIPATVWSDIYITIWFETYCFNTTHKLFKPKDNNSNNKPQQQRSTSKTRRQNSQNVESNNDDQVGTAVNHQRARKKVSTPQQSIKNEYCVTTNSSISNLTTNCERDSLLRPHSNTGNGSVKTGVLASESLRQSLS